MSAPACCAGAASLAAGARWRIDQAGAHLKLSGGSFSRVLLRLARAQPPDARQSGRQGLVRGLFNPQDRIFARLNVNADPTMDTPCSREKAGARKLTLLN